MKPSSVVTDTRGRGLNTLRISVMDRCNFRCGYCMPVEQFHARYRFLERSEQLDFDEIVRLTRVFARLGVTRLRLTGGEPLLREGLADLVNELHGIDGIEHIALTTNGVLLAQQAPALKASGLDRVTVSLDAVDPVTFARINGGRQGLQRVLDGIRAAREAGLTPVKVNTVVQRGVNEDDLLPILARFRGTGVIVRLIEFMDVGNLNHWRSADLVPSQALRARIHARWPLRDLGAERASDVAQRCEYADGGGEIGFISSVTAPFCGACTRARLSSDGVLYTCLFASNGTDLRAPLRAGAGDEALQRLIARVWRARADRYSELRGVPGQHTANKVEMYYIGG